MNFKDTVKKILPHKLVKLIYRRRILEQLWILRKSIKKIEEVSPNLADGPKIVFILQFSEAWNSFCTVYEAALKKGLSVIVLCVPTKGKEDEYVSGDGLANDAYEFCLKNKIVCVNAWQEGKWFNMEKYNPDYVIYSRPYNSLYPKEYKSGTVCRYAKICYIPYAFSSTTGKLFEVTFNISFITDTYITFTPSKIRLKECKRKFKLKNFLQPKSFVYLGYPRFDLYTLLEPKKETKKTKILWLPRWTAPTDDNKQSHFLDYFEQLIDYVVDNEKLELMIRPHPLMFSNFVKKGVLTEQEVKKIIYRVKNIDNISFDVEKNYIYALKNADIIISDYSSLLIEIFVTEKPIIFCDKPKNFNEDTTLMDSVLYHADCWDELKKQLGILIGGQDPNLETRKQVIKKIVPNFDGHIGERILNYIITDYEQR